MKRWTKVGLIAAAALAVGFFLGRSGGRDRGAGETVPAYAHDGTGGTTAAPEAETIWTCAMHPQIRMPEPGKCPICGMELIPLPQGEETSATDERRLTMTETGRRLAEVVTAPVRRLSVHRDVRMVGKVAYDETRVKTIAAWVPGRIERMFVDWTGVAVNPGDHMVVLYSPELLTAQRELQQSARRVEARPDDRFSRLALDAAREKLRLLGLTEEQIAEIERKPEPSDRVTILAPAGGIVVERLGFEGMYVDVGTPIYKIADLSRVWVHLDAYESDIEWLRLGQEVAFEAESLPGEPFHGRITFIQPVLDEKTRTVKVRVDVPNEDGRLKPGMFVRAVVRAKLGSGGVVADDWLADKWICPMHPEVVSDGPGTCPKCGMPLATAEALGYARGPVAAKPPLVVPRSAPLVTGTRAVVYVEVEGAERPTYEGRVIRLGPRAGDYYVVHEGLAEGERVVVEGAFKIDSALQIQGRPSMMSEPWPDEEGRGNGASGPGSASPAGNEEAAAETRRTGAGAGSALPEAFSAAVGRLIEAYLSLQEALAGDDAEAGAAAVAEIAHVLDDVPGEGLDVSASARWERLRADIEAAIEVARAEPPDLEKERKGLDQLTQVLDRLFRALPVRLARPVRRVHCPMAFDNRGADWFQRGDEVRNPYLGSMMLGCGDFKETVGGKER